MIEVPETSPGDRRPEGDDDEQRRVIWIEMVESEEDDTVADPFDPQAVRSSLKHNGGAKTLSEAIHDAAGGADRVQLQVIRERLLGIEARTIEMQLLQRRHAGELRQIRLAVNAAAGLLALLLVVAVILLLV